jgi:phage terminase large subunit-like protein
MSELIDYGSKVNAGEVEDASFHLTLFSAPEAADPWDPETWKLANPALDDFRSLEDVQRQAAQAQRVPSMESAFRNLILNQRVAAHSRFIAKAEWDACNDLPDVARLRGRPCFGGLDLSAGRDLTALVLVFPDDNGGFDVLPYFFLPAVGIAEKAEQDRVPYDVWARKGHLTLIPGSTLDPGYVADSMARLATEFKIEGIAYDRWRINDLKRELGLIGADLPLVEYGQGFRDMGPAVDRLERAVAERQLRHGGHPVLNMCAANAVIERDPAGNRKLSKAKAQGRIDGLVALAMALAVAGRHEPEALPLCLLEAMEWAARRAS